MAMNQGVTKSNLSDLEKSIDRKIDKAVDDLSEVISNFASQVDGRFKLIEEKLDRVETSIDRLTNTIDGFVKRLDDIEADNTARDAQLARLERWIEQVAQKAGIKLEY